MNLELIYPATILAGLGLFAYLIYLVTKWMKTDSRRNVLTEDVQYVMNSVLKYSAELFKGKTLQFVRIDATDLADQLLMEHDKRFGWSTFQYKKVKHLFDEWGIQILRSYKNRGTIEYTAYLPKFPLGPVMLYFRKFTVEEPEFLLTNGDTVALDNTSDLFFGTDDQDLTKLEKYLKEALSNCIMYRKKNIETQKKMATIWTAFRNEGDIAIRPTSTIGFYPFYQALHQCPEMFTQDNVHITHEGEKKNWFNGLQFGQKLLEAYTKSAKTASIILCGPTGTGKTAYMKGIAQLLSQKVIVVFIDGPLLSNASEIATLMNQIEQKHAESQIKWDEDDEDDAPLTNFVICINEGDALLQRSKDGKRSEAASQLMSYMDKFSFIITCNIAPEQMEEPFLRPGRTAVIARFGDVTKKQEKAISAYIQGVCERDSDAFQFVPNEHQYKPYTIAELFKQMMAKAFVDLFSDILGEVLDTKPAEKKVVLEAVDLNAAKPEVSSDESSRRRRGRNGPHSIKKAA